MMAPISAQGIGFFVVLQALGINHTTAPLEWREPWALSVEGASALQQALCRLPEVCGAVCLSTCGRTEVYVDAVTSIDLTRWLAYQRNCDEDQLAKLSNTYQGSEVIQHLMRVAAGMDSPLLGEPQILGQLKSAYALAERAACVSPHLKQLFPAVFCASKHIRSATDIGKCPVSVAYLIVQMIKRQLDSCGDRRAVLLLGGGQIMELVATHLQSLEFSSLLVAGRRRERVEPLAQSLGGQAISLGDMPVYLPQVDWVISATASSLPLIGKGLVERVMQDRTHPLCLFDLAVPRDIEPEVAQLSGVTLYNIDDLHAMGQANTKSRQQALVQAEAMIALHAADYERKLRLLETGDLISRFRQRYVGIEQVELQKALGALKKGQNPEDVLLRYSHNMSRKILHQPTRKLREFAARQFNSGLLFVKDFFEL